MPKDLPPPQMLRKVLRYEPDTGRFFWRERTPDMFKTTHGRKIRTAEHACKQWNQRYAGTEAFTASQQGARVGNLLGLGTYLAHRVAFAHYHGRPPRGEVDHINGRRDDNRICNLREATRVEQSQNMPKSCANKSGHVGVYWITRLSLWGASIQVSNVSHWLGYYETFEEACAVRKDAEKRFGFHPNHGREPCVYPREKTVDNPAQSGS